MWRPDLEPLPCRQSITQTIGADGRHNFAVRGAVPSGTILEVSLCVEVSVFVVDQFPFLWDFVLTGGTENAYTSCNRLLPPRAHTPHVLLQMKVKLISENVVIRSCISSRTLLQHPICTGCNHQKDSRAY